jgi:hypothetical protein
LGVALQARSQVPGTHLVELIAHLEPDHVVQNVLQQLTLIIKGRERLLPACDEVPHRWTYVLSRKMRSCGLADKACWSL